MQAFRAGPRQWYLIDAKAQLLGRLAARVTPLLIGKHKPIYKPSEYDCGDCVIVINSQHVELTGDKWKRKLIRWHTGWPGGLKEFPAEHIHDKDPTKLVRRAIWKMLPKNKLRNVRMERLHIFANDKHPFDVQFPVLWEPFDKDEVRYEQNY